MTENLAAEWTPLNNRYKIQRDLDKLEMGSGIKRIKFIEDKCKIPYIGRND